MVLLAVLELLLVGELDSAGVVVAVRDDELVPLADGAPLRDTMALSVRLLVAAPDADRVPVGVVVDELELLAVGTADGDRTPVGEAVAVAVEETEAEQVAQTASAVMLHAELLLQPHTVHGIQETAPAVAENEMPAAQAVHATEVAAAARLL